MRILIADDDPDIRVIIRRFLQKDNYSFTEAADGQEALEKISERAPDLVILDIMMPFMDGITFLKKSSGLLKEKNIPVIVVTALKDINSYELGEDFDAADILIKPFERDILSEKVRHALSIRE
ncbi:MAG: response regulator [Fibrobacterota bacterium]